MKKIICHPDNFEAIRSMLEEREPKHEFHFMFGGIEIKSDPHMERDRLTGKFVLPTGEAVERNEVNHEEPFITYGPDDIDWLLYAGIVKEHKELVFYEVEDSMFRLNYDFSVGMLDRRAVLTNVIV